MNRYTIGVDFGTQSARAVLLDCDSGCIAAVSEYSYPHGVITGENDAAYQDPRDYLEGLQTTVKEVAAKADGKILALGIDFTACTALAVDEELEPLALAKLWKSHSARSQAQRVAALCRELGVSLAHLGDKVSSEWLLPKLLETYEETPQVYARTRWFLEAADYLVWKLTGNRVRSQSFAGFKGLWEESWPPEELFVRLGLDSRLLEGQLQLAGSAAGTLNAWASQWLGLPEDTVVTTPIIDAHGGVPGGGMCRSGDWMLILGTSGCHELLSSQCCQIPGIMGRVKDAILPGLYVYETSQCAMGDLFGWFMENSVPHSYWEKARQQGLSLFDYMEKLAANTQTSLIALEWWNGCRAPYGNDRLTGSVFGYTLATRPEEIYRALMEALAFNTRQILEQFTAYGVPVERIRACGGIAKKNPLFMQILTDVLQMPVQVAEQEPSCAIGTAVLSAWGAGVYPTAQAAVEALAPAPGKTYYPREEDPYGAKYREYLVLAEDFANRKKPVAF